MISFRSKALHAAGAASAALLLTLAAPAPSSAAKNFACSPAKVKGSISEIPTVVSGTTFTNVVESAVSFRQGGNKPSCVMVHFVAAMAAETGESIVLRARLDNNIIGLPETWVATQGEDSGSRVHPAIFVFRNVAPGPHTVTIQARGLAGDQVLIGQHTTLVHFVQ